MLMLAGCRTPGASGGIIRGRRGDYGLGNDSVLEIVIEMTLQFVMVNVCERLWIKNMIFRKWKCLS